MSKKPRYRIKEYNLPRNRTQWVIERRSIFGFWYNPNNREPYDDGWYNSFMEAEQELEAMLHKTTSRVVKEVYTK